MKTYKITCILSSLLFFYLVYMLLFKVEPFLTGLGFEACAASVFLAKRASMLMLGFALLSLFSTKITDSNTITFACIVLSITWFGLAAMSGYETITGTIGSGLIPAMIIEALIGFAFAITAVRFNILKNPN